MRALSYIGTEKIMFPPKPDGQTDIQTDRQLDGHQRLQSSFATKNILPVERWGMTTTLTHPSSSWNGDTRHVKISNLKDMILFNWRRKCPKIWDLVGLVTSWGSLNNHSSFLQGSLGQVKVNEGPAWARNRRKFTVIIRRSP